MQEQAPIICGGREHHTILGIWQIFKDRGQDEPAGQPALRIRVTAAMPWALMMADLCAASRRAHWESA